MTLSLIPLEDRHSPAIFGAIDGFLLFPDDSGFRPFGDFSGPISSSAYGDRFVVGAGETGGPRVSTSEGTSWFAYEPTFRGGVNVSREADLIAVGSNPGGGPVVVTYRPDGTQIARWFVNDPNLRGGVSVSVHQGFVYTVGGLGAGPRIDCWTPEGILVSSFFGAPSDLRAGWSLLVADGTNDGVPDYILTDLQRTTYLNDGVTLGRAVTVAPSPHLGHNGTLLTYGDQYLRGVTFWNGYSEMLTIFDEDGSAGNPNPPPTSGFRPGQFRPTDSVVRELPTFEDIELFGVNVEAGDEVGNSFGRGTAYAPMYDGDQVYIVTARHVASRNPFLPANQIFDLVAHGVPVGEPSILSDIRPDEPYEVDAAAFLPFPEVTVSSPFRAFSDGTEIPGTPLYSIGQGDSFGLGRLVSYQTPDEQVFVNWGNPAGLLEIKGQIFGEGIGGLALLIPGFSGGPVWTMTFGLPGEPPIPVLVGMGVAGRTPTGPADPGLSIITPALSISNALGLAYDRQTTD